MVERERSIYIFRRLCSFLFRRSLRSRNCRARLAATKKGEWLAPRTVLNSKGCTNHESKLTPVSTLAFCFGINPRIVDGSLRVALSKAQGLHWPILRVSLSTLDANVFRLNVFVIVKDQPTIFVPEGDALVHAVVPRLKTLDGPFRRAAKHARKILLDALPLEFPVVPSVNDEIPLFCGVFLINVSPLIVGGWAGVTIHS